MRKLNREKSYNFPKVTPVVHGRIRLKAGSSESKDMPLQEAMLLPQTGHLRQGLNEWNGEDSQDQRAGKTADASLLIRPQPQVLFGDVQILTEAIFNWEKYAMMLMLIFV